MAKAKKQRFARAVIERGQIVIRLDVPSLPLTIKAAGEYGFVPPVTITDAAAFAKEMARELNREDEQGTTRIDQLFDDAVHRAVENGAEGWEPGEEDDG